MPNLKINISDLFPNIHLPDHLVIKFHDLIIERYLLASVFALFKIDDLYIKSYEFPWHLRADFVLNNNISELLNLASLCYYEAQNYAIENGVTSFNKDTVSKINKLIIVKDKKVKRSEEQANDRDNNDRHKVIKKYFRNHKYHLIKSVKTHITYDDLNNKFVTEIYDNGVFFTTRNKNKFCLMGRVYNKSFSFEDGFYIQPFKEIFNYCQAFWKNRAFEC